MTITVATLVACGVGPTQARIFAEPLDAACRRFDVVTSRRIAAFVTQWAVESADFTRMEEDLYYRSVERVQAAFRRTRNESVERLEGMLRKPEKFANYIYAGINGNHDEASGDGWKYRGRGPCMLTGRSNYADAADGLGLDLLAHPELVATPAVGSLVAGWFWHSIKGNVLADSSMIDELTRAINGRAMLKADERRTRFLEALKDLP